MSGLYRLATGLIEPLVLGVGALVERADEKLRRDRRGELTSARGGHWLHAASAGEMRGLIPLVRTRNASQPLVLTAQTAAGMATGRAHLSDRPIHRMPFDLPAAMRRAFDSSGVAAVILAETELWPNMLEEAHRRDIPVALVNARISNRSWSRYRASRSFWRKRLDRLRVVAAQSEVDAERFRELGVPVEALAVTGNMKHDHQHEAVIPASHPWGSAPIVVLGSVRKGEERALAIAMKALQATVPDLKVVVGPRHRKADDMVEAAFRSAGFSISRRSRGGPDTAHSVLLLDTMGELNSFYSVARVAFVGGTWQNYGGHNVAEPALVGIPVIFGPYTDNCRLEADALVGSGAGRRAATMEGLLTAFIEEIELKRGRGADRCRQALVTLSGATGRLTRFLTKREFPGFR
ncbi:MAG: glycosyltransferase N-terminal domain-containing protein [Candidatus Eisenbacteria bacterium]|nr:glycosyltransferase N-terminal domain-containing protein [Candidatus Eisenbacteria bacterium]